MGEIRVLYVSQFMLLHKLKQARDTKAQASSREELGELEELLRDISFPPLHDSRPVLRQKIEYLARVHREVVRSCEAIRKYESDLNSSFASSGFPSMDGQQISTDELLKRSYLMILEADRQYKAQDREIKRLENSAARRKKEIAVLRSHVQELETSALVKTIDVLRENCMSEVPAKDGPKRAAIETLIEAFEKSEKTRASLQDQVLRLKSFLVEESRNDTHDPKNPSLGNIFMEIIELREIVKSRVVDVIKPCMSKLRESEPRLLVPSISSVEPLMPDEPSTSRKLDSITSSFSEDFSQDLDSILHV